MNHRRFTFIAILLALSLGAHAADSHLDVLVFAPHPDDEVISSAGLILQGHARGQRIGVVMLTNGDGFPALAAAAAHKTIEALLYEDFRHAGALRQQHSLNAAKRLGLRDDEVIFLGYPDSALTEIYQQPEGKIYTQQLTKMSETYGLTQRDYHTIQHGRRRNTRRKIWSPTSRKSSTRGSRKKSS